MKRNNNGIWHSTFAKNAELENLLHVLTFLDVSDEFQFFRLTWPDWAFYSLMDVTYVELYVAVDNLQSSTDVTELKIVFELILNWYILWGSGDMSLSRCILRKTWCYTKKTDNDFDITRRVRNAFMRINGPFT